jgi:hypothetical protein
LVQPFCKVGITTGIECPKERNAPGQHDGRKLYHPTIGRVDEKGCDLIEIPEQKRKAVYKHR